MTSRRKRELSLRLLSALLMIGAAALPASAADTLNPIVRVHLTRPNVQGMALISCDRPFVIENERGETIMCGAASTVSTVTFTSPSSITVTSGIASLDPEASESGIPSSSNSATASEITVYTSGGTVQIASDPVAPRWHGYHGDLRISPLGMQLNIVNILPLETYLLGVLGPEIGGNAPAEAMKAQAVASRTYTIKNMGTLTAFGADLDDTTRFQSYTGMDSETPAIRDAVSRTLGRVMTYDGQLIDAAYATDCGGRTALGPMTEPYLQPVDDPDCAAKDPWTYSIPLSQLAQIVTTRLHKPIGTISDLETDQPDRSGRVGFVTLSGGDGASVSLTAAQIRQAIGYDVLKSTWFTVTITPDQQCAFTGRGWGHGLGMCQRGAIAMARGVHPASDWEILTHYYTGVQVVLLTPDLLPSSSSMTHLVSSTR